MESDDPRMLLRNLARQFYLRGWMDGTSGNLSLRAGGALFITASGRPKGNLSPDEILVVPLDENLAPRNPPTLRPSAEISIHRALYRIFPEAGAVFHVHTVEAALASGDVSGDLPLPPIEVLKGLGVRDPASRPALPVFENDLVVPEIARKIEERLAGHPDSLPGLLIRHHGTTAWGNDWESALRHLELLEFCFRFLRSKEERGIT